MGTDRPNLWVTRIAFLVGGGLLVSALVGFAAGLWGPPKPALAYMAFEVSIFAAGVFGVLLGLGRFARDIALTALCIGGVAMVASALGLVSLGPVRQLGALPTLGFAAVRVGLGALLIVLAVLTTLNGRRDSWRMLIVGIALALPALLLAAMLLSGRPRGLMATVNGSSEVLKVILALGGGLLFIALTSAAGHLIIRAFQTATEPPSDLRS